MGQIADRQPHVLCLGAPNFAGEDYLASFAQSFQFSVPPAADRAETITGLPDLISRKGSIDAFAIRMGTPPYDPFDEELLSVLESSCKMITSASIGYNEFNVDWMSCQGIIFCNSFDAIAEATADMAVFLLLTTLRNTSCVSVQRRVRKPGSRDAYPLVDWYWRGIRWA